MDECVYSTASGSASAASSFRNDVNARQNEPVFVVYVYPLHFHLLAHHPKITHKLHRVQVNDVYDCEFCTLISSFSHLTWRYARLDWRMFNKNISNVLFLIVVFRPFPFSSISCKRHSKFHFIIFCLLFSFMHYTNIISLSLVRFSVGKTKNVIVKVIIIILILMSMIMMPWNFYIQQIDTLNVKHACKITKFLTILSAIFWRHFLSSLFVFEFSTRHSPTHFISWH